MGKSKKIKKTEKIIKKKGKKRPEDGPMLESDQNFNSFVGLSHLISLEEHEAARAEWEKNAHVLTETIHRQKHTLEELKNVVNTIEQSAQERFEKSRIEVVAAQNARQQALNELTEVLDAKRNLGNQVLAEIRRKDDAIHDRNEAIKKVGVLEDLCGKLRDKVVDHAELNVKLYRAETDLKYKNMEIERYTEQISTLQRDLGEIRNRHSNFITEHQRIVDQLKETLSSRNELEADNINKTKEILRLTKKLEKAGIPVNDPQPGDKPKRPRPASRSNPTEPPKPEPKATHSKATRGRKPKS